MAGPTVALVKPLPSGAQWRRAAGAIARLTGPEAYELGEDCQRTYDVSGAGGGPSFGATEPALWQRSLAEAYRRSLRLAAPRYVPVSALGSRDPIDEMNENELRALFLRKPLSC
jgi:hypothetical protein